ncbi:MAG: CoA transferase [Chloroflexi bacterium]|nr:CoA transferase [Chloroflexota bacterium]
MSFSSAYSAPLAGVRIIDLAGGAAAFCSKLLADLGADVIKVEPPGGCPSRQAGPFVNDQKGADSSLSFWYHNSGKSSVALDLENEPDRQKFIRLAASSHALVESFRPGYLESIGLGYGGLCAVNPGLVVASVTGFGQSGPYSQYKSSSLIAAACGGQMHVCGRPGRPPLKPYGEQPYYLASLFAACGILLALRRKEMTGLGQHIDISLQEATAAALEHVLVQYFYDKTVPGRQGSLQWNGASDIFPCRDGHVLLTLNREWDTLVELLGSKDMAAGLAHPAWRDADFRSQHTGDIQKAINSWTCMQDREEIFRLGQDMRFPWAVVYSIRDVMDNEQLKERGYFINAEHLLKPGGFRVPRPVIDFAEASGYEWKPAPVAGEHNGRLAELMESSGAASGTPLRNQKCHCEEQSDEAICRGGFLNPPENAGAASGTPLQGIRVLDFTWMLAGPYATRLLADFGAEVIKVQSKLTATGAEQNDAGYFASWNRNKLGITLDLSRAEARQLALELVSKCDLVMENFTPRVMEGWGLGYHDLKLVKPDIVMISLSGFGHSGPWRNYAALGTTVQATSGITHLTSYNDGRPDGIGFAYADHISGLYAALAALAALRRRDCHGQGAYVDISELEAACSTLGPALLDYSVNGRAAAPAGNKAEWGQAIPHGCYRCKGEDRWCVIAVFSEEEWQSLCHVMGQPQLARQEKFSSARLRLENADELDTLIETWTVNYTSREVMDMLQSAGVPAAAVNNAQDLADDPQLSGRGFFVELEHPVLGLTRADGNPIRMSAAPALYHKAAPLLGADNRRVFIDILGMEEDKFGSYLEDGIIG